MACAHTRERTHGVGCAVLQLTGNARTSWAASSLNAAGASSIFFILGAWIEVRLNSKASMDTCAKPAARPFFSLRP